MQRLSERQLTDIHIFCADLWHTKYEQKMYVVRMEASMQASIGIEAIDTILERAPSAVAIGGRADGDDVVVGVFTDLAPLLPAGMSNSRGVS